MSATPEVVNPRTPAQVAARERLERATEAWGELPLDAIDRWRLHGMALGRRGDLVFRGLGAKYLQLHGGRDVPSEPPATPFVGDGVVVTAGAVPVPPGGNPWIDGAIRFVASGPNADGVVTELLFQRLRARHVKPKADAYRTQTFVAFAGESMAVPAAPGAVACAVRFVRAATGPGERGDPAGRGGGRPGGVFGRRRMPGAPRPLDGLRGARGTRRRRRTLRVDFGLSPFGALNACAG